MTKFFDTFIGTTINGYLGLMQYCVSILYKSANSHYAYKQLFCINKRYVDQIWITWVQKKCEIDLDLGITRPIHFRTSSHTQKREQVTYRFRITYFVESQTAAKHFSRIGYQCNHLNVIEAGMVYIEQYGHQFTLFFVTFRINNVHLIFFFSSIIYLSV